MPNRNLNESRGAVPHSFPLAGILAVLLLTLFLWSPGFAGYATPGTFRSWNSDSLVAYSNGAVTGANHSYRFYQSVTVSPTDTLRLQPGDTLIFTDNSGTLNLLIQGTLVARGTTADSIIFTSSNQEVGDWKGLEFRNGNPETPSELSLCRIEYARSAIRAIDADPLIDNCLIRHNSDAAADLTGSNAVIRNCRFIHNRRYTLKMTLSSSPRILNNYFEDNNFENQSPYVIITVGLQGVNSPIIRGNTIVGGHDKSGGIVIWGASNAVIEQNRIERCAYGIFCYQAGADPLIRRNILLNNNINPDTLYFGFGIACNGANHPVITGNSISGHFYGVAVVNGGQPNLGDLGNADTTDDGGNRFTGNGIGNRKYELYNNNPLPLKAEGNWWGTDNPDSIEARIVHHPDNPAYGTVDYVPYLVTDPLMIVPREPPVPRSVRLTGNYPNPFNSGTVISFELLRGERVQVLIFDLLGRRVRRLFSGRLTAGSHRLWWNGADDHGRPLSSGIYFYRLTVSGNTLMGKMTLIQ